MILAVTQKTSEQCQSQRNALCILSPLHNSIVAIAIVPSSLAGGANFMLFFSILGQKGQKSQSKPVKF